MSDHPVVSVIIPAYNKAAVLPETLGALARQTLPTNQFEVILVDDGSSDDTLEVAALSDHSCSLQVLRQANRGAGAARNLGVQAAAGRVLLFLDADIVATPDLLAAHLDAQARCCRALVAGRVRTWPPSASRLSEPVLRRKFDLGPCMRALPFKLVFTQNLSVKSAVFDDVGGFDERLPRGQDIEFGYRALSLGVALAYEPRALAYHNHPLPFAELCQKEQRDHGELVPLFRKRPNMMRELAYLEDKWPISWAEDEPGLIMRKVGRRLLALGPIRGAMRVGCGVLEPVGPSARLLRFVMWKTLASYQLVGLREGMARYGWEPTGAAHEA